MSTQVFDDAIDLQIGLIAAEMPSIEARGAAYPFPALTPLPDEEMRRFRTTVLENDFLRATIVPGLGGRILSLFDKRTGKEILRRYPALTPQAGGVRGAFVREGIQLRFGTEDRLNALGNVDTAVAGDGVWIAESAGGTGLSFHLHVRLPDDRAELLLEARVFNRTLKPVAYNGSLALHVGGQLHRLREGVACYDVRRDCGLAVFWPDQVFDGVSMLGETLSIVRWDREGALGPRQLDTFQMRIVPLSNLGDLSGASFEGGAYLSDEVVRVQVLERQPSGTLLLGLANGETLEAPADLYPERVHSIPLGGLPAKPVALVLRSEGKDELLRVDLESPIVLPVPGVPPVVAQPTVSSASTVSDLRRTTLDPAQRSLAHTLLAMRSLSAGDFSAASVSLEQALLYNGEDHLAWWLKAVADRLAGAEGEQPELLNAHYLAPLDPVLRAESFLAQGTGIGREPSPIVEPLTECPENLIEVAALLTEAGLLQEANRWIDEALRHRDLPMLHILQAYGLTVGTRMLAEAADHIRLSNGIKEPPFPYRHIEWTAIETILRP